MDRQALRDWVLRFNEAGVAGLHDRARPSRICLLAEAVLPELAALIADGPQIERDGVAECRLCRISARCRGAISAPTTARAACTPCCAG
jgi:hypothetical protein